MTSLLYAKDGNFSTDDDKPNESEGCVSMKLKPVLKPVVKVKPETPKKEKSNKLPPDTYTPMLELTELQISDNAKLVFSVSRKGDDGLPHIDIRTHIKSEQYTGPTKKGINFDTELLYDFMEIIDQINKELEKRGK